MYLTFNDICSFLEAVEKISLQHPRLSAEQEKKKTQEAVTKWFAQHRQAINSPYSNGGAILSALFPHRRKDRVYGLQPVSLSKKIHKLLNFNHGQLALFENWKDRGQGEIGACLEKAMKCWDGTFKNKRATSLEKVDNLLVQLASKYRFSDPAIRKQRDWDVSTDTVLHYILTRLASWEAKWLVRLILREYCTIELDENFVLGQYHFLLPDLLKFQNNFDSAIQLLKTDLNCYPPAPSPVSERAMRVEAGKLLKAVVGIKVGRPSFYKAWSFNNCLQMLGNRAWAAEVKYDGEYCEIHIDQDSISNSIQIFSKNGKDATADRKGLHGAIQTALRIGQPGCLIKRNCIVLGELVIYSDREQKILPFSKIRKHVSRSGSFLGNLQDSLPHEWEHLMIVFFDVLMLDDEPVLRRTLQDRRSVLRDIIQIVPGRSMRSEWTLLDLKTDDGVTDLKQAFAQTLAKHQEGLILKPLHTPYFSLLSEAGSRHPGFFIKLKKDYLGDMGGERDLGDFAIIGARYDAQTASKSSLKPLHWTHFYLGCSTNKSAVQRFNAKPKFKVVGVLSIDTSIPRPEAKYLNDRGCLCNIDLPLFKEFDIEHSIAISPCMTVAFKMPFVAEVLGGGYEKAPNEMFEMLRHPRIKKVHHDRTWEDAVCMDELYRMAEVKWEVPDADKLDGHARDVALLAKKYVWELGGSQATASEQSTTQETTQCSTPRTTQEASLPSPGDAVVQETQQTTQTTTTSSSSASQFSRSTQGVGIRASKQLRILVREDASEQIRPSPSNPLQTVTALLPTPPKSSLSKAPSTSMKRSFEAVVTPPPTKRRRTRLPLKDAEGRSNVGQFDYDSQEKVIHVFAEEGWRVEVHPKEPGLSS
ncbi:hypothetical protein P154DRAFT_448129 [Amniculicola lignicola CBS 123094]|uniref:ATP-dependent DNA ligase family profile domain-containing protein n=1 Tax=Amniculicola lignicola CBS 123094 TaxID=1392246 RepID=A0A6A5VXE4_9PLEO|nr:hypothetical protein P154DRAFT_448129 [Amniculicola lignicola CBS 123094]